jgi:two-component SAPR family response regulator
MSESLLVVDDDELVRDSLELEAADAGYRVACAASGSEALALARHNHFDVVVCDIRMPGMDGLEVIERLKRLQPYIRTIVITGYASPDTPVRALKMRVDDYLLKPFDGPAFLASVRQVLDRSRSGHREGPHGIAHQEALLGIFRSAMDGDSVHAEMAEFAATRAGSLGFSPRRVRLVYLCALLYRVDLSFLAPFSGLRAVARILREARESTPALQPESRVLAEAVADFETGERSESFSLPEADWIGVGNLLRLASKHRALGKWDQAEALYKRILAPNDLEEETALAVGLEQFVLSIQRGKPVVSSGHRVLKKAAELGLERIEARAILHLGRIESVEPAVLGKARRVFESSEDLVEMAACDLLLERGGQPATKTDPEVGFREQALQMLPELATGERADDSCLVRLFGPFRVAYQGQPMPDSEWVSRKDRLLFAYLSAHSPRVLTEETLLELLWQRGGEKARHSLHNSVSQARRVLSRLTGLKGKDLIERVGDGYRLGGSIEVDLCLFRQAFEHGQRESLAAAWEKALSLLQKAERVARGEFMEGDYQEWTFPMREEIAAQKIELLSILARYFGQREKEEKAYRYWRRVLELDNCREEAYEALFRFLRSAGRESEAFKLYQSAEVSFEEELGLSVPDGVVRAYQGR